MFDNMITGEDCSCADTTEPSNLTSLHSDDVTSAVNSDVVNEVCTKTIEKGNDAVEGSKGTKAKLKGVKSPKIKSKVACPLKSTYYSYIYHSVLSSWVYRYGL